MPDSNHPIRWQPDRAQPAKPFAAPSTLIAMLRGARGRCPACGLTRAFSGYLRVVPQCAACGAPLGALRADDAPPYFTIFIVAHVVIGLMVLTDRMFELPFWLQVTTLMSVALLRPVKGATLGLMLQLGFMKSDAP